MFLQQLVGCSQRRRYDCSIASLLLSFVVITTDCLLSWAIITSPSVRLSLPRSERSVGHDSLIVNLSPKSMVEVLVKLGATCLG